jgi:hypothetical protein|tara:strand:+ start:1648 stop:2388 length:741 start_codon:yes stop_codon:yes gene_type:complete
MKQPKKKYSFTTKGISGDVAGDFAKKTGETVENLPQFNFRGKDAFKGSLSKGPNATPQVSFTKGEDKKLPYLSSRFKTDTSIKDPMRRNDRSQTHAYGASTIRQDDKRKIDAQARRSITGNRTYLSEQEKAAKESSKIGENLQSAMSSGDEKGFSKAVYKAQDDTRESEAKLLSRPPGKDKKGNYIENDASYQNAKMIDAFNTARQDAVGAQDFADFSRGLKGRIKTLKADLSNGFKTTFDERSGS